MLQSPISQRDWRVTCLLLIPAWWLLLLLLTAEFSIWTREAGAGGLSIAVEGPSKAEIAFEDHKDGSCGVSYTAQEPGMDILSISKLK